MDEVLGDVPSEGGDSSRRFGIYRAFTPEPRIFSVSRLSLLFVACIAGVVAFAVFFPMIQFASRSSKAALPFPEIANRSIERDASNTNCSSNVLSFGHDCTEPPETSTKEANISEIKSNDSSLNFQIAEVKTSTATTEDDSEVVAETRDFKIFRQGRSKPVVSTPYPYYFPKPTQGITDRMESDVEEANIFAIPSDMNQENVTDIVIKKPRINFTPPPYAFTPYPNFTDSYAQLLPYKTPTNHTNFEEILRYMNSNEENLLGSTTEKPIIFGRRRTTTMKVSGTYKMPLDRRRTGEVIMSSSDKTEEARPFFNGHAYVSDPFVKFRPSNPVDVNRLAPLRPDIGSRLRRPFAISPSTPLSETATPYPEDRDLRGVTRGSYTEAIFHGAGSVPQPSNLLTPPPQDKPLSITLDIYPVTMEMPVSESPSKGPSIPPWRERGRYRPLPRPRWRPQAPRTPAIQTQPQAPQPQPDNHMVVHLNLFPNKRKQYTFPRRGGESLIQTSPKATLLVGGQFGARSLSDLSGVEQPLDQHRATTASVSSTTRGWSSSTDGPPEYSALTRGLGREGEPETSTEPGGQPDASRRTTDNDNLTQSYGNESILNANAARNKTNNNDGSESDTTKINSPLETVRQNYNTINNDTIKTESENKRNITNKHDLHKNKTNNRKSLLDEKSIVETSRHEEQFDNTTMNKVDTIEEYEEVTLEDDIIVSTEPFSDIP